MVRTTVTTIPSPWCPFPHWPSSNPGILQHVCTLSLNLVGWEHTNSWGNHFLTGILETSSFPEWESFSITFPLICSVSQTLKSYRSILIPLLQKHPFKQAKEIVAPLLTYPTKKKKPKKLFKSNKVFLKMNPQILFLLSVPQGRKLSLPEMQAWFLLFCPCTVQKQMWVSRNLLAWPHWYHTQPIIGA